MVVVREVSQEEISALNDVAELNISFMLVTLEVSHVDIWPYLASVAVSSLSHSSTALESVESSNEVAELRPLASSTTSTNSVRDVLYVDAL